MSSKVKAYILSLFLELAIESIKLDSIDIFSIYFEKSISNKLLQTLLSFHFNFYFLIDKLNIL